MSICLNLDKRVINCDMKYQLLLPHLYEYVFKIWNNQLINKFEYLLLTKKKYHKKTLHKYNK